MHTHLALLRGINVSGHNMIKMDVLKSTLEKIGFQKVQTYIQSGNVFLDSDEESDTVPTVAPTKQVAKKVTPQVKGKQVAQVDSESDEEDVPLSKTASSKAPVKKVDSESEDSEEVVEVAEIVETTEEN